MTTSQDEQDLPGTGGTVGSEGSAVTPDPLANAEGTELWLERTGHRAYVGRSSRGGEVRIGSLGDPDSFTPGELLKIALGACTGLSADAALSRRLGDDVAVTIRVGGLAHPDEDRYPALAEVLEVDLSGLDPQTRERLLTVVHRSVDQHCTVGRTLEHGATTTLTVAGEG